MLHYEKPVEQDDFDYLTFPASRLATVDVGRIGASRHVMAALVEADVERIRRRLRGLRREGGRVSFTAWLVKTVADCIAEHPEVQGIRAGRRRVALPRGVDVAMPIERMVDGRAVPLVFLLKSADTKSAEEIEAELAGARGRVVSGPADYVLHRHEFSDTALGLYYRLPGFLRRFVMVRLLGRPGRARRHAGTVMMTSLGAAGVAGWVLPLRSLHSLSIAVAPVVRLPRVVGEAVVPRDVLRLTLVFDHDVVDGAPAGRFVTRLVRAIEAGHETGPETEKGPASGV